MKIVLYVDYSNCEFNNDFKVSNLLISKGHNVFLAVNNQQFDDLIQKCDIAFIGKSSIKKTQDYPNIKIISDNVDSIIDIS